MARFLTPLFFLVVGIIFMISSFNLKKAPTGNANELRYFPLLISTFLVIFSIIYLFREWNLRSNQFKVFNKLLIGRTPFLLIGTILLMIGYIFIFERIGFLISTTVFLGCLLFLINGKKKWLTNILVAILFSSITWYLFGVLLKVSLP